MLRLGADGDILRFATGRTEPVTGKAVLHLTRHRRENSGTSPDLQETMQPTGLLPVIPLVTLGPNAKADLLVRAVGVGVVVKSDLDNRANANVLNLVVRASKLVLVLGPLVGADLVVGASGVGVDDLAAAELDVYVSSISVVFKVIGVTCPTASMPLSFKAGRNCP